MKIILTFSKTKRAIESSFSVCGNKEDLVSVAKQILNGADRPDFIYGWVDVFSNRPPIMANTPVTEWDDEGRSDGTPT